MPTNRKLVFANDHYYHIFNRSTDRKPLFQNRRDYTRMISTLDYYRFVDLPVPFSKYLRLGQDIRKKITTDLKTGPAMVEVIAWCLMPNHYHLLIKQIAQSGITKYMSNIANSYGKYLNTKTNRRGPVFESRFKAVFVETDEQSYHLSRYIHLNPLVANIISETKFKTYEWSSLADYLGNRQDGFVNRDLLSDKFRTADSYLRFVMDQKDYALELHRIKHLVF